MGSRALKLVMLVAAVGAVVFMSLIAALFVVFAACDAEAAGVDEDSAAGHFCGSPVGVAWLLLVLVGPAAATLLVGSAALRGRDWRRVAWKAAGMLGLLVVISGVAIALPNECSDAEYRAYDRWRDAGSPGEPPAVCDSY